MKIFMHTVGFTFKGEGKFDMSNIPDEEKGKRVAKIISEGNKLAHACGGAGAGILSLSFGENSDDRKGWVAVEQGAFRDEAAFQAFRDHEAHKAFADMVAKIVNWCVLDLSNWDVSGIIAASNAP